MICFSLRNYVAEETQLEVLSNTYNTTGLLLPVGIFDPTAKQAKGRNLIPCIDQVYKWTPLLNQATTNRLLIAHCANTPSQISARRVFWWFNDTNTATNRDMFKLGGCPPSVVLYIYFHSSRSWVIEGVTYHST